VKTEGLPADWQIECLIMTIKYLYKYYSLNDHTKRIFTLNEIYFPSPLKFNDPFDFNIPISLEGSKKDYEELYRSQISRCEPNLNREERRRRLREHMAQKVYKDINLQKELSQETATRIKKRYGVLCLTETNDNILMWSHYADNHRGVCVEFKMCDDFNVTEKDNKVIYQKELPECNLFKTSEKQRLHTLYLTKSCHWSYEKEWRMFKEGPGAYTLPDRTVNAVILGCQMTDKEKVTAWLKEKNNSIAIYEAKMKHREFGLDIMAIKR
jgi:hypothetical protein